MIVIAPGLTLVDGSDINADNPLVGYQNVVTSSLIAADTEDASYPVENLANVLTSQRWQGSDTTEQYLTVTTDGLGDIDYLAVARHNFGTIGSEVVPEGKATSGGSFTELTDPVLPGDDAPILFRFDAGPQYQVRLKIGSGSAVPRCAILYTGELLVMQRRLYVGHTPLHMGLVTDTVHNRSQSGEYVGSVVTGEHLETQAAFANITPSWYRANMQPFIQAAKASPFFFAWRPDTYPLEVGFAWFNGDVQPQNSRSNGMMSVTLPLSGIAL